MFKRDYLERLIEQMAEAVQKAMRYAKAGQTLQADKELDAGYTTLGVAAFMLDRLDPASIRMLAGDKVAALVTLLQADAEIAAIRGDMTRARRRTALANGLEGERERG